MKKIWRPAAIAVLLTALTGLLLVGNLFAAKASDEDKETGSEKAWLGIYMQDLNADIAEALNIDVKAGVLINHVIDDSPAEKGGIENGDVIVRIDDQVIDDSEDLSGAIKAKAPGDNINIAIVRKGEKKDLRVVLGSAEERIDRKFSMMAPRDYYKQWVYKDESHGFLGVELYSLGEQLAGYFGVKEGVLISEVEKDSPAEKAGLKAGDIITAIDGKLIETPGDVSEIIQSRKEGEQVELAITRNGTALKISAEIAEREMDSGLFGYFAPDGSTPHIMMLPDLGDLDFDFDLDDFDYQEFMDEYNQEYKEELKQQMEELREQLNELKEQLNKMQKDLH